MSPSEADDQVIIYSKFTRFIAMLLALLTLPISFLPVLTSYSVHFLALGVIGILLVINKTSRYSAIPRDLAFWSIILLVWMFTSLLWAESLHTVAPFLSFVLLVGVSVSMLQVVAQTKDIKQMLLKYSARAGAAYLGILIILNTALNQQYELTLYGNVYLLLAHSAVVGVLAIDQFFQDRSSINRLILLAPLILSIQIGSAGVIPPIIMFGYYYFFKNQKVNFAPLIIMTIVISAVLVWIGDNLFSPLELEFNPTIFREQIVDAVNVDLLHKEALSISGRFVLGIGSETSNLLTGVFSMIGLVGVLLLIKIAINIKKAVKYNSTFLIASGILTTAFLFNTPTQYANLAILYGIILGVALADSQRQTRLPSYYLANLTSLSIMLAILLLAL